MTRRVGIVAKARLTQAAGRLAEIGEWLGARGVEPVFETETAALAGGRADFRSADSDRLPHEVDLIVVLGGDGTLLGTAGRIARAGVDIPILGVNFGGLGFLTEITLPELYPSLEAALAGTAQVDHRLMLRSVTERAGRIIADRIVLNDVVITKGALARIIDLSVWVDGQFLSRFRSDGLIIASPTGSTAYNLAAAGPIIHPQVNALVLTPIAPHTLTNRPIVIPASASVRVQPLADGTNEEIFLTLDGQFSLPLETEDVVTVRSADVRLRLVRASTRSYFEVLREKLKWGER